MNTEKKVEVIDFPKGFESLPQPIQDFILYILAENKALKAEIAELKARLSRNSSNSNTPPSTDQYVRKSKPKSEREKSGKKTGGQPGHPGETLQPTDKPDLIQNHDVGQCHSCHYDLSGVEAAEYLVRQECDIPPVKPVVTEHRMSTKICPKCKSPNKAEGPKHLTQPIQYGPRVTALATYFHYEQLVPLQRTQDIFQDLFSLPISEGTLVNMHEKVYDNLEPAELQIKQNLLQSPVNNFDETSMYINGKTQWLHVVSNETNTFYSIHPKRGSEAMDAINILPQYTGNAVHDHWQPYFTYDRILHGLCNAHHVRELRGIHENYEQPWAQKMRQHLKDIHNAVKSHKEVGKTELPAETLKKFSDEYDLILHEAQLQVPVLPEGPKKRGRTKQHPAKNLLDRLTRRKLETLRFMYDFRVPFTNNQAERDVRMAKLKQKVSGCFRSAEGGDRFCRIRGYNSTSRKRGINVLCSLENAARGRPEFYSG